MNVTINGNLQETGQTTIAQLVAFLVDKPDGLIVELNKKIIKRDQWDSQPIADGDHIELISFVGGG